MTTKIVRGSNQEIAEVVGKTEGKIIKAILMIEESSETSAVISKRTQDTTDDPFAEMEPFMVDITEFDDSREAIYTRQEGE